MRSTPFVIAVAALVGLSCDVTGPKDFSQAVWAVQCGPADGPATLIVLSNGPIGSLEPNFPYLSVTIWHPLDSLTGTAWHVDGSDAHVSARYVTGPAKYQNASFGTVRIARVGTDYQIDGRITLRFPSRFVADEFSAVWLQRAVLCG